MKIRQQIQKIRSMPLKEIASKVRNRARKYAHVAHIKTKALFSRVRPRVALPDATESDKSVIQLGGVPGHLKHLLLQQGKWHGTPDEEVEVVLLDTASDAGSQRDWDKWVAYGIAQGLPILAWVHTQLSKAQWTQIAGFSEHIFISDEKNFSRAISLKQGQYTILPPFVDMMRIYVFNKNRVASVGLLVDKSFLSAPDMEKVMEEFLYWVRKDDACLWFLGEVDRRLLQRYPELGSVVFGVYNSVDDADPDYSVDVFINMTMPQGSAERIAQRTAAGQWVLEQERPGILSAFDLLTGKSLSLSETLHTLQTQWETDRKRTLCVRRAVEQHSAQSVLYTMEQTLEKQLVRRRTVTLMACTCRPESLPNILDNYHRQTYLDKDLLILFHTQENPDEALFQHAAQHKGVRAIWVDAKKHSFGQALNIGVSTATGQYVTKMDDDDYYGAHYVADTINTFSYFNVPVLGHDAFFLYFEGSKQLYARKPGRQYRRTTFVCGATLTFERTLLNKVSFRDVSTNIDGFFCADVSALKLRIFCLDLFNLLVLRVQNAAGHTWTDSDNFLKAQCLPCYPDYDKQLAAHRAYLQEMPTVDWDTAKEQISI